MKIVTIMRVRNEEDLIKDSLTHTLSFSDQVIVLDDASTDATPQIINSFQSQNVILIEESVWHDDRLAEETRHRALLLQQARDLGFDWCLYLDCDERLDFDIRAELSSIPKYIVGVKFRLFDAYMTPEHCADYTNGDITQLHRQFGPEFREILMAWRFSDRLQFVGKDQREPTPGLFCRIQSSDSEVKHFGKAISLEQWDRKCRYYSKNFPEPYRTKWKNRIGKPLHTHSDFGNKLVSWSNLKEETLLNITPAQNFKSLLRRVQVSIFGTYLSHRET